MACHFVRSSKVFKQETANVTLHINTIVLVYYNLDSRTILYFKKKHKVKMWHIILDNRRIQEKIINEIQEQSNP